MLAAVDVSAGCHPSRVDLNETPSYCCGRSYSSPRIEVVGPPGRPSSECYAPQRHCELFQRTPLPPRPPWLIQYQYLHQRSASWSFYCVFAFCSRWLPLTEGAMDETRKSKHVLENRRLCLQSHESERRKQRTDAIIYVHTYIYFLQAPSFSFRCAAY